MTQNGGYFNSTQNNNFKHMQRDLVGYPCQSAMDREQSTHNKIKTLFKIKDITETFKILFLIYKLKHADYKNNLTC